MLVVVVSRASLRDQSAPPRSTAKKSRDGIFSRYNIRRHCGGGLLPLSAFSLPSSAEAVSALDADDRAKLATSRRNMLADMRATDPRDLWVAGWKGFSRRDCCAVPRLSSSGAHREAKQELKRVFSDERDDISRAADPLIDATASLWDAHFDERRDAGIKTIEEIQRSGATRRGAGTICRRTATQLRAPVDSPLALGTACTLEGHPVRASPRGTRPTACSTAPLGPAPTVERTHEYSGILVQGKKGGACEDFEVAADGSPITDRE